MPDLGPRAAALGMRSEISIRLEDDERRIGALNMYGTTTSAFDREAADVASICATHTTNAIATSRKLSGLRTAVDSRHRIGIAQGILINAADISVDQSFAILRRLSSTHDVKLRTVADLVLDNGRQPEPHELDQSTPGDPSRYWAG